MQQALNNHETTRQERLNLKHPMQLLIWKENLVLTEHATPFIEQTDTCVASPMSQTITIDIFMRLHYERDLI